MGTTPFWRKLEIQPPWSGLKIVEGKELEPKRQQMYLSRLASVKGEKKVS